MGRRYELMRLRYREGKEPEEVQAELGVGHGEYFRLQSEGIEAIVQFVAEWLPEAPAPSPAEAEPSAPAHEEGRATAPPQWGPLRVHSPLVGRNEEIEFLKGQYETAASGEGGHLLLLSGEAGVGKTRLIRELGQYARERGGEFLEGRWVRVRGQPYRAWTEALSAGLRGVSEGELAAAIGQYGELAQFLPQLVAPRDPAPGAAALDAEHQRLRLYDGVFELILHLSRHHPLVLLLDDLHWAASLYLLLHVARRLKESRALVVAVYRDQELSETADLVLARTELQRARLCTPIELHPLNAGHTAQIVAHTFGEAAAAQLGGRIHTMTRGNPFFVEEVLAALVENGAVERAGSEWAVRDPSLLRLPESVQLVVRERVTRLGERTTEVLQEAAVLGQEFNFMALVAMTGLAKDEVEREIDRGVSAGLLEDRSSTAEERFAFRDDRVWEVLFNTIPTVRRRRYHRQAGESLEAVYEGRTEPHVEELAHHFTEGHDSERAAGYCFQAAQKSDALFLWSRAIPYYRNALELWEELGGHLEEQAATCELLGDACYKSGLDAPRGIGYLQRAIELYRRLGNRHKIATLHSSLGREQMDSANLQLADQQKALQHFDLAQSILEQEGEGLPLGLVQCSLALAYLYRLDCERAVSWARSAFGIAERLASPALLANARVPLGVAHAHLGEVAAGLGMLELGWQTAWENGLAFQADLIRSWGSHLGVVLKSPEVGFRWTEWAGPGDHQTAYSALVLPSHLAALWALKGELGRARQLCDQLAASLAAQGQPSSGPWPSDIGLVWLRAGDWDRARRLLQDGLQWAQASHNHQVAAFTAQVLGQVSLEMGDLEGASTPLTEALTLFRTGRDVLGEISVLPYLSLRDVQRGDVDGATAHLDEAEAILMGSRDWLARPQDWGGLPGDVYLAQGVVRGLQGRWPEADRAFQRAIESHQRHGLRWDEARAWYEWGCSQAGGDETAEARDKARESVRKALILWDLLGAQPYAERCRSRLASLG